MNDATLAMFDRLEDMAIANATKRLRKLSVAELRSLYGHYFGAARANDNRRDEMIRLLAIELVADDR